MSYSKLKNLGEDGYLYVLGGGVSMVISGDFELLKKENRKEIASGEYSSIAEYDVIIKYDNKN